MEFSRLIAIACFRGGMWLMVVTGTLFLFLAAVQHAREEANANPQLTIGTGVCLLLLALLLRYLAQRTRAMKSD